jgi:hypothetical protein
LDFLTSVALQPCGSLTKKFSLKSASSFLASANISQTTKSTYLDPENSSPSRFGRVAEERDGVGSKKRLKDFHKSGNNPGKLTVSKQLPLSVAFVISGVTHGTHAPPGPNRLYAVFSASLYFD